MVLDYGTALANPGIVLDGSHLVEAVHFARALGLTRFARGGETHVLEWTVVEPEISMADAVQTSLNHAVTAPRTVAQLVIELESGEQWRIDSAAIESWSADSTQGEGIIGARTYRAVGGVITATHAYPALPATWTQLNRRWADI